jgi:hypothetical protein
MKSAALLDRKAVSRSADFVSEGGGYRCIPAGRLMAAQAEEQGVSFSVWGQRLPAIVVFSPVMFMPAVIDVLEELVVDAFGSAQALCIRREPSELGILREQAEMAAIDGSPEGLIRGLFIEAAWQRALWPLAADKEADLTPVVASFAEQRAVRSPVQRRSLAL